MVLTTHAITGAAIASIIPTHPVLGFVLGFGSHFVLDSIPHWDYKLLSSSKDEKNPMNNDMIINKNFVYDLFKIGFDVSLGFILAYLFFGVSMSNDFLVALSAGAVGGVLPDALQFVYFKFRREPIYTLQKFHVWIHSSISLNKKPLLGISTQALLIILVVLIQKFFVTL